MVGSRVAKSHRDCAYCGCGGDGLHICGRCHLEGIRGPVIRGTAGRIHPDSLGGSVLAAQKGAMRRTLTVRQLIERLEGEDPEAKVVFVSNYGDHARTQQAHFLEGRLDYAQLEESAYSESGYALRRDEDGEGEEVLVIR